MPRTRRLHHGEESTTSQKLEQSLPQALITSTDPLGEAARRGAQWLLQMAEYPDSAWEDPDLIKLAA